METTSPVDFSSSPAVSPIPARVKVVNPIGTMGPSSPALIVAFSDDDLQIRFPCSILTGSTVLVRTGELNMFGQVRWCRPGPRYFEIGVDLRPQS